MRSRLSVLLLGFLVILAVVVGLALYLLNDEDFLKAKLGEFVRQQTGRDLVVDGPLLLDLGRQTTIEARGIRFRNAGWADPADMVSLGHLRVTIDVPSLFDDVPVIPSLLLEDCDIRLEENEAGEANWDVLPEAQDEPERDKEPARGPPVLLLDTQLRNCHLKHDAPERNQPLTVAVDEFALLLLDGSRWQVAGRGQVNGQPLSLAGNQAPAGALLRNEPLEYDLELKLGQVLLRSSGSVEDARTGRGADLTVSFSGPEMARVLEYLNLPPLSDGGFDFRMTLDSGEQVTDLSIDGDLGSLELDASGQLDRLLQPQSGAVNLALSGPNLRALGEALRVERLVPDAFDLQAAVSFNDGIARADTLVLNTAQDRLELGGVLGPAPRFANSRLVAHAATSDIGRWRARAGLPEATVGPAVLSGELTSDSTGAFSVTADLTYVGSSVHIEGGVRTAEGLVQPDVAFSLESPDAAELAMRLGLEKVPGVPFSAEGRLTLAESMLQLRQVEAALGNHRAAIDGFVNPAAPFTGTSFELNIDSPDAAELGGLLGRDDLPAAPLSVSGEVSRPGEEILLNAVRVSLAGHRISLDGRVYPEKPFIGSSATVHLVSANIAELGRLLGREMLPAAAFEVRGRISRPDRRLHLEEFNLDLAGHRARIDGYLNPDPGYAGSNIDVELDTPNVAGLALLFDIDGLPEEPMKLSAMLRQEGKGLAFRTSQGSVGEITLAIDGHMPDLNEPTGVDADFDVRLPRLTLLAFLAPDTDWPDLPFSARGRFDHERVRTRLENVQLELGMFAADVSGELFTDRRFAVTVAARGPDASQLEPWVGRPLPPLPVSLAATLEGNPAAFEVSNLDARLGPSEVVGTMQIGLGESKSISGRLESPYLDASRFWADEPEEEPSDATQQSPYVFDETPVVGIDDFGTELDLELKVGELDLGNTQILDIDLGIGLTGRRLELSPLALRGAGGGAVSGGLVLDASGAAPELRVDVTARDLRLGLAAAESQNPETYPPVDADIMLTGTGATHRQLAASLNGKVRFYARSGQIASSGLGLILNDFLTELLTSLNPFSQKSEYTTLDCSVTAATFVDGQVEVFPVVYQTEQLTILTQGAIDLHTEKIDLSFNTKPRKGIGISAGILINPLIKVGGTLASPAIELDPEKAVVSGALAVATVGISLLAKSTYDRFLSSNDPCGDARSEIAKRDAG